MIWNTNYQVSIFKPQAQVQNDLESRLSQKFLSMSQVQNHLENKLASTGTKKFIVGTSPETT